MKISSCVKFVIFLHGILGVYSVSLKYNTYATSIVKNTPYNPRVINKICFLEPEEGPCRANLELFYFSPMSRNCSTFKWGGCQGNGNRFNTRTECEKFCIAPRNEGRSRPQYCSHSFDYGFCFGSVYRWYFDFKWKICKKTIYSGCGGNRNNFESLAKCELECRLGKVRARPTTVSDRMKKVLIINPPHATTRKSRIQITTKPTLEDNTTKCSTE